MVILLHHAKNQFELLHRYPSAGSTRNVGIVGYKQLQSANPSVLPAFKRTETSFFRNAPVSFAVYVWRLRIWNLEWVLMKFDMPYF